MTAGRTFTLVKRCLTCKNDIKLKVRPTDICRYYREEGAHVQEVFPYLTAGERELLISGICPECFEKLFGGEEDE